MTTIDNIVRDVAETLAPLPVPVLVEEQGDIANALAQAVAKQSMAVTVSWSGFTPQIVGKTAPHESPFGMVGIVVSIFENVVINRRDPTHPRLLALAQEIAKMLDGAASDGMEDTLHLTEIARVSVLERGIITTDVSFKTKATL